MGPQGWSIVTGTGKPVKPSNHLFEVEAQKLSVEVAITREKPQLNLCKVGEKVPLLESEKHDRRVGAVCFVQAPTIAVTPQKICFGPKVSHPSTACTAFLPRMLRNACRCLEVEVGDGGAHAESIVICAMPKLHNHFAGPIIPTPARDGARVTRFLYCLLGVVMYASFKPRLFIRCGTRPSCKSLSTRRCGSSCRPHLEHLLSHLPLTGTTVREETQGGRFLPQKASPLFGGTFFLRAPAPCHLGLAGKSIVRSITRHRLSCS